MEKENHLKWILFVFMASFLYAFLRYIIFKGVLLIHFPLYIVNKIAAFSGLIFLSLSLLVKTIYSRHLDAYSLAQRSALANRFGNTGFFSLLVHLVISISILSAHYYPKFYIAGQAGRINLTGELSLLMGVLGFLFLLIFTLHFSPITTSRVEGPWLSAGTIYRIGILIYLFAASHVLVMGYKSWYTPEKWPGSMPPMTIISFVVAIVPLIVLMVAGKIKK